MKKRLYTIILSTVALLLACFLVRPVDVKAEQTYVYDEIGTLTGDQLKFLNNRAKDVYDKYGIETFAFLIDEDNYEDEESIKNKVRELYNSNATTTNSLAIGGTSTDAYVIFGEGFKIPVTEEEVAEEYTDESTSYSGVFYYIDMINENAAEYQGSFDVLSTTANTVATTTGGTRDYVVDSSLKPNQHVVDNYGLLSSSEREELTNKLDAISNKHGVDVVVYTTDSVHGFDPMLYAADFLDYNNYKDDAVAFMINMGERDRTIVAKGKCKTVFEQDGIYDYMWDSILPELKSGDYEDAFDEFADYADMFLTRYENGEDLIQKGPLSWVWIPVSAGVGAVVAIAIVGVMRGKLKTVHSKTRADEYLRPNSMELTVSRDLFLYNNVIRVPIKDDSNSDSGTSSGSFTSSSGTSYSGSSGKF